VSDGPPAAPRDLKVVGIGDGFVDLAWDPNAEKDLNGKCAASFEHRHEYMLYQDGTWLGPICGTATRVTGLTNGQTYRFSLAVYDNEKPWAKRSARSAQVSGTPSKAPTGVLPQLPSLPIKGIRASIFDSDFEDGEFSGWTVEEMDDDRVQIVDSRVRSGQYGARFEVRPGDVVSGGNRAEVRTWSQKRFHEGDDLWFGWSTLFDENFPSEDRWALIMQLKNDGTGSPPIEMAVQDGEVTLKMSTKREGGYSWFSGASVPIDRGKWHDFVMHVRFSEDPSQGFVELWHNGELIQEKRFAATLRPGLFSYLKLGYYRSAGHTTPGVVWHDSIGIGRSRQEVDPAA